MKTTATETSLRLVSDRDTKGRKLDRSKWVYTVKLRGVVLYSGSDAAEIAKAAKKAGL